MTAGSATRGQLATPADHASEPRDDEGYDSSEEWGSTNLETPAAAQAMQALGEQLLPELVELRRSFSQADPDAMGTITLRHFQRAVLHVGLHANGKGCVVHAVNHAVP